MVQVEIAVQDVAGARVAHAAGADRVELCTGLVTGGLTPSIGLLEATVATGVPVHALIRSRPGGFVLDDEELAVQVADVRAAVRAGAAGVVVGALTAEAEVDAHAVARLVEAAGGATVTFHRALDVVRDRRGAVDRLASLGVTRVLTSGGAARAGDAVDELAALVRHAAGTGGAVQVMAGGGVRVGDIPALVAAGVDAVHLSARRPARDLGAPGPGGGAPGHDVTDDAVVRAAVQAVRDATSGSARHEGPAG